MATLRPMSGMQATRPQPGRALPRSTMILLSAAAGVVVILGLRELSWLAGPILLALVIVVLVHPLH